MNYGQIKTNGDFLINYNDTLISWIFFYTIKLSIMLFCCSSVDWALPSVVAPLYSLYLGTWGGMKVPPDDRKLTYDNKKYM